MLVYCTHVGNTFIHSFPHSVFALYLSQICSNGFTGCKQRISFLFQVSICQPQPAFFTANNLVLLHELGIELIVCPAICSPVLSILEFLVLVTVFIFLYSDILFFTIHNIVVVSPVINKLLPHSWCVEPVDIFCMGLVMYCKWIPNCFNPCINVLVQEQSILISAGYYLHLVLFQALFSPFP